MEFKFTSYEEKLKSLYSSKGFQKVLEELEQIIQNAESMTPSFNAKKIGFLELTQEQQIKILSLLSEAGWQLKDDQHEGYWLGKKTKFDRR